MLGETTLLVNKEESEAWTEAMSNGRRPMNWFELQIGESVAMDFEEMAPLIFPEPGEYELELILKNEILIRKMVTVLP